MPGVAVGIALGRLTSERPAGSVTLWLGETVFMFGVTSGVPVGEGLMIEPVEVPETRDPLLLVSTLMEELPGTGMPVAVVVPVALVPAVVLLVELAPLPALPLPAAPEPEPPLCANIPPQHATPHSPAARIKVLVFMARLRLRETLPRAAPGFQ